MEHEIHSVYSLFWRNAYVAALQAGHQDPAAAADEAFMAFDCRFGEVQKEPDLSTFLANEVAAIEKEIAENAGNEFIPHHGWVRKTDRLTAAEQMAEAWAAAGYGTQREGFPPLVPLTEGLPPPAEKSDDEVLG